MLGAVRLIWGIADSEGGGTVAMRTIDRRLRKLEESFALKRNDHELSMAEVVRERRRRRLAAAGEPFVEAPQENLTSENGPRSISEILRSRFHREDS